MAGPKHLRILEGKLVRKKGASSSVRIGLDVATKGDKVVIEDVAGFIWEGAITDASRKRRVVSVEGKAFKGTDGSRLTDEKDIVTQDETVTVTVTNGGGSSTEEYIVDIVP